jgi:uncharacterized protein (TIGR04255 family)
MAEKKDSALETGTGFVPVNGDHAVFTVAFAVQFDDFVTPPDLQAFANQLPDIQADLPANSVINNENEFGVLFSYRRPDSSAVWALRFAGNSIAVECTQYTRWERVSSQAFKYLTAAITALLERRPDIGFGQRSLQVRDKFIQDDSAEYDISSALKPSDLLIPSIFSAGKAWHSHFGWFEDFYVEDETVLNRLEVASSGGDVFDVAQRSATHQWSLIIDHFQEVRSALLDGEEIIQRLDSDYGSLHKKNKEVLTKVLTDEMQDVISLWDADD